MLGMLRYGPHARPGLPQIPTVSEFVPGFEGVIYGDRNQKKDSGYHTEEGHGE